MDALVPAPAAWRLTWYPRLILAAIGVAFVVVLAAGDGSSSAAGRVGGDYPAFYTAGTLVEQGRIDDLYDTSAQAAVQDDLLGGDDGYLGFAYAPHVAAAYAPLAALPYRASYAVHTLLMVAAVVAALHLLRPVIALADERFALVVLAAVTSYPVFMAVGGGQNTALTLLLLAVVWRALAEDREVAAGVAVAVMLFRPQYALPVLGLLLLGRHTRAVAVASVGAAVLWLLNATLYGWSWVSNWLDQVAPFLDETADANAPNAISLLGFARAVLGVDSPVAAAIGGTASLAVAGGLAWMWWTARPDLDSRMAITAAGLVLLSPHALFYDAGLIVATLLVVIDRRRGLWPVAAMVWAAGLLHLARHPLGATPFALVVAAVFVLAVQQLHHRPTSRRGRPVPPTEGPQPSARVLPIHDSWSVR